MISPPLGLVSSRGLRAAIALGREGLARVRIRPVGVLLQSRGHALFFCLFLVVDRHDYRVTSCVHRRNTGRTSRIAPLCCLSVLASRVVLFRLLLNLPALARVRIRPRRGRRAALARWQGRASVVSHTRRTSLHEPRYQYTAICYCCWASCRTSVSYTHLTLPTILRV